MFLHTPFHQTIVHLNDSSNFDSSFEVKYIPTTAEQNLENRCITQSDREALIRFVQEFEALQLYSTSAKSTPKKSPPTKLDKECTIFYDNIIAGNTPVRSLPQSPADPPVRKDYRGSNLWSSNGDFLMDHKSINSLNSTRSNSPVFLRSSMGCKPLSCCDQDIEPDDGIELMGSNLNSSGDLSFDMHPPLLPQFNITPPPKQPRNAAYDLARFLRGSFHVKRAKITHLRRSLSETENFQSTDESETLSNKSKESCVKAKKKILEDTTNRNDGICLSVSINKLI